MSFAIGMDFGTSNSTVAHVDGDKPRLVPLEGEHGPIPSALFFDFVTGTDHFGREAIELYTDGHSGRLMRSLKSVLGTTLMGESTRIRTKMVPFEQILGTFIRNLKSKAEHHLGREVTQVVMGRPVQFVDDDPVADRLAQDTLEKIAHAQGFKHVRFQLEPIAAALDYEQSLTRESLALIADIGGGTADFTVARLGPRIADDQTCVLANGGVHIGGTDMDRILSVTQVMPLFGLNSKTKDGKRNLPVWPFQDLATWHRINGLSDAKALSHLHSIERDAAHPELFERLISVVEHRDGHRLAGQVEAAKVSLSTAREHVANVAGMEGKPVTFNRLRFEDAVSRQVERLKHTCVDTLARAGVGPQNINAVFLTGGTTQIPVVDAMLRQLFPESQFVQGDVFGSVGLGLALEAKRMFS